MAVNCMEYIQYLERTRLFLKSKNLSVQILSKRSCDLIHDILIELEI